jgi:hypothetical protein
MGKREELINMVRRQGLPVYDGRTPFPVVSLERFFEGNTDYGSIGCNLSDHPGPEGFYRLLKAVRDRDDVQDVLIEVYEIEEDDDTMWPFSERLYVLTRAAPEQIAGWLSPLQPDEIGEGYAQGKPAAAPQLEPGLRVLSAWWD